MKQAALILFSPILFSALACAAEPEAGPVPAPSAPTHQPPGAQPAPTNISDWADRCTDFTVNGWGFKDPKNFVKLMGLFSDPAIYLEFSKRMQDPESYARVAGKMMDPATAKNYMEWSDPSIYLKWMQAFMDPNFYAAAMQPFMNPATYMHWMALPMDQRAWAVGANMMNPGMWTKWMAAGTDSKVTGPLAKAADPNTPTQWLQAAGDPANFRAWSGWPTGPSQSGSFNPFNPGSWFAMPAPANPAPLPQNGEEGKP